MIPRFQKEWETWFDSLSETEKRAMFDKHIAPTFVIEPSKESLDNIFNTQIYRLVQTMWIYEQEDNDTKI